MKWGTGVIGAVLALALATGALAASGVTYTGSTTQTGQPGGTVRFTLASKPTAVKGFSGDVWATCGSMQVHITLNPTPDMAVHHHAFSFSGRFNIANGTVVIAKKVDGQIHGTFGHGGKATGTMSFTWTFDANAPAAFVNVHCTTGAINYTAAEK